jgi:hypothetical protein
MYGLSEMNAPDVLPLLGLVGVEIECTNLKVVGCGTASKNKGAAILSNTSEPGADDRLTVEITGSRDDPARCAEFLTYAPRPDAAALVESVRWMAATASYLSLPVDRVAPLVRTRWSACLCCCTTRMPEAAVTVGTESGRREREVRLERCSMISGNRILDDAEPVPADRYELHIGSIAVTGMVQITVGCHLRRLHKLLALTLPEGVWLRLRRAWRMTESEQVGLASEERGFLLLLLMYVSETCTGDGKTYRKTFFNVMPRTDIHVIFAGLSSDCREKLTDPTSNHLAPDVIEDVLRRLNKTGFGVETSNPKGAQEELSSRKAAKLDLPEDKSTWTLAQRYQDETYRIALQTASEVAELTELLERDEQESVGRRYALNKMKIARRVLRDTNMFYTGPPSTNGAAEKAELSPIQARVWLAVLPSEDLTQKKSKLSMGLGEMGLCKTRGVPLFELRTWVTDTVGPENSCCVVACKRM